MGCGAYSKYPSHCVYSCDSISSVEDIVNNKVVVERLSRLGPGQLYVDVEFFGSNAIYYNENTSTPSLNIVWKRPKDFISKPCLFKDGACHLEIMQGDLQNTWFLNACTAISLEPRLWEKIIPLNNKLINGFGLYEFRFWRFGNWIDTFIDDYIPTIKDSFLYAHSKEKTELWPALIEKAYAKINGCYEALNRGKSTEALTDLTGAIVELFYPHKFESNILFSIMKLALNNSSFIVCNMRFDSSKNNELISDHVYSITFLTSVDAHGKEVELIRLCNPWKKSQCHKEYSDKNREWQTINVGAKTAVLIESKVDAEFWMKYSDFYRIFSKIYICTSGTASSSKSNKMFVFHGSWIPGTSAGGCSDDLELYSTNPQYVFSLKSENSSSKEDNENCESEAGSQSHIVISLTQKYEKSSKKICVENIEQYINFRIYKLSQDRTSSNFSGDFFTKADWISPLSGEADYLNSRDVTSRFLLSDGTYLLVPSMFDPHSSMSFLLRFHAWCCEFSCRELVRDSVNNEEK